MQSGYPNLPNVLDDGLSTDLMNAGRFCFNCEQIFSSRKCLEEHHCSVPSYICSCGTEFTLYKDMLEHNSTHEPGYQVLCHETIKKRRIEKRWEEEEKLNRLQSGEVIWESPLSLPVTAASRVPISTKKPQGPVKPHVPPNMYPQSAAPNLLQNVSSTKDTSKIFSDVGAPTVDLWTLFQPVVVVQTLRPLCKTKSYNCGKCGQSFATRKSLVVHHNTHIADKVCGCIGCGLLLSSRKIVPRFHSCHSPHVYKFKLITARPLNRITTNIVNGLGPLAKFSPLKAQNPGAVNTFSKGVAKQPAKPFQTKSVILNAKLPGVNNLPPKQTTPGVVSQPSGKGYECRVCHVFFESINVLQRHKCAKAHEFLLKHKITTPANRQRQVVPLKIPSSSLQNSVRKTVLCDSIDKTGIKNKMSNLDKKETSAVVSDDDCFIVESGPEKPAEISCEKSCYEKDLDPAETLANPTISNSSTHLLAEGAGHSEQEKHRTYVLTTPENSNESSITNVLQDADCDENTATEDGTTDWSKTDPLPSSEKGQPHAVLTSENLPLNSFQREKGVASAIKSEDSKIEANSVENNLHTAFQSVNIKNCLKHKDDKKAPEDFRRTREDSKSEPVFCTKGRKRVIKCSYCSRTFKFQSQLIIHERIHTGEKPYSCPECGRRFNKNSNLNLHLKVHSKNRMYDKCSDCPIKFANSEYCTRMKTHTTNVVQISETLEDNQPLGQNITCKSENKGKNAHVFDWVKSPINKQKKERKVCQYCGKSFTFQSALVRHIRVHTGEKPYKCDICGKAFGQAYFLRVHELTHWSVKRYNCTRCGKAFAHYSNAKNHTCRPRHNSEESLLNTEKPALTYTCHICRNVFDHLQAFKNHMKDHTGARLYRCLKCDKLFGVFAEFTAHKDLCYQNSELQLSRLKQVECLMNETLSVTQYNGFQSVSEHNTVSPPSAEKDETETEYKSLPYKKNPFLATIIPSKHFSYIVSSLNKLDNRSDPRKYFCPSCGRLFRHLGRLRAHMLTHRRDQRYTCTCCGKTLGNWHKLWQHQRIHRQRHGRFSCPQCGRGFRFVEWYKKHMSEHPDHNWVPVRSKKVTVVLHYQCEQCQCKFRTLDLLFKHQRCHSLLQEENKYSDLHLDFDYNNVHSTTNISLSESSINSVTIENHVKSDPSFSTELKQQTDAFSESSFQTPGASLVRNNYSGLQVEKQSYCCYQGKKATDSTNGCLLGKPLIRTPTPKTHTETEGSSEEAQCAICGQPYSSILDLYLHYLQHARGELSKTSLTNQ